MRFQIGNRFIGDSEKPYIIAEVGSNWRTREDCLLSVQVAKATGADAVKFQLFTPEALYGKSVEMQGALDPAWLPELKAKADRLGIDFMCTAFSPELLRMVDPHVRAHKIASAELTHVRLLEAAKGTGKPIFLSTGASGRTDIDQALKRLESADVVLLYCVASYPARIINLRTIPLMRNTFQRLIGYSDHSTDVGVIPKAAVAAGACVLEKHMTAFPEENTPDRPHSLTQSEFTTMVEWIKHGEPLAIAPGPEEQAMVLKHNRRLIVTKPIKAGERLLEGQNFGAYRALSNDARALPPWALDQVNGRSATKDIAAGDGIGPGDYA